MPPPSPPAAPPPLALSPSDFRAAAERVLSLCEGWLGGLDARAIHPHTDGAATDALFAGGLPEEGLGLEALGALEGVLAGARAQNGRFLGYVLGSGEPVAALGDLLASVLNQNVTAWRSGPSAVSMERAVVACLARAVGCEGFSGSLTGGGSMANLMGLAMAREALLPANEEGARPGGVVYASAGVHMSIPKALALLGLGRRSLRLLPQDAEGRLEVGALAGALADDRARGLTPLAVVASAGTVNTGAVDPLEEVAALAREAGAWLHVDGAYGALAALAAPERFRGLALADSLSLDAHKWLYQPVDCGVLLFRDRQAARRAFSYAGDYVRVLGAGEEGVESFAFFDESVELSRRFRALKLWLSLRFHGLSAFRRAIARDLAHAQLLAARVREVPALELLAPVPLSAVCFRYRGDLPEAALDAVNARLLGRVNARGRVYLSNATLPSPAGGPGRFALRACFVNHRTRPEDVGVVVDEVLAAAEAEGLSPSRR
jgi:glutamate/tyrosine decarboxylase-like PLP-dependent enzyme